MACNVRGDELQGLMCPLCLDTFRNATILNCGHTFCQDCLETYDEQHRDSRHIICPVCRGITKLGRDRVKGLTRNYLVEGLQDELHEETDGFNMCLVHTQVQKNIFCEVCQEFVCMNCYINDHQGHTAKTKEKLEEDLKNQKDDLIQKCTERQVQIEACINDVDKEQKKIYDHITGLENNIRDAFAAKVTIITDNEERLVKQVSEIRTDLDNKLKRDVAAYNQMVHTMKSTTATLTKDTSQHLDQDMLKKFYLKCCELEKMRMELEKATIDAESKIQVKQGSVNATFCVADKKQPPLGHIEPEERTRTSQRTRTSSTETRRNVKPSDDQTTVKRGSLHIKRKVELPDEMFGMSAISKDAVVIAYGEGSGIDNFSVSGYKTQHISSSEGYGHDIALLSDGRSVVSRNGDMCYVYDSQGIRETTLKYKCKRGVFPLKLCSDSNDNIYAVNFNKEIYIFSGNSVDPMRVVSTGNVQPFQISVTKTGLMITSTPRTFTPGAITVFDKFGHVGGCVIGHDDVEFLYATVDDQDRVLVARVKKRSDIFRLTRYTLNGNELVEEMTFSELKLLHHLDNAWCYLSSLTQDMFAFSTGKHLYFIKLEIL